MRSNIKIAVPPGADPEMTENLLSAIRENHSGYVIMTTESSTGKYHWDGGYIHPSETARSHSVHEDEYGRRTVSEIAISLVPLGCEITQIISRITGDSR